MTRLVCALLLAAPPVLAQLAPAQAPTPTLSGRRGANFRLVEMEALAIDPAGHLAPGLTSADFALNSERKIKIESCVYVDTRDRRTLVFLVDDLGLAAEAMVRVRAAIQAFVDTSLKPGDRLAILRSGEGSGDLQQLTGDKEVIGRAIARIVYNPRSALYSKGPLRSSAFTSGALGTLRLTIEGLLGLTGHKSIVLFSPDLNTQPLKDLEGLAATARRAEVSVYGIDPVAENAVPVATADSSKPAAAVSPGAVPLEFTNFALAHLDLASGMAGLARRTAGEVAGGATGIDGILARALAGTDGYYRIAFPDPDLWAVGRLTVTRTGYELLASRQVTDSARDLQAFSPPRQNDDDLPRAMSNPFFTGGLHVRLTPLFFHGPDGPIIRTLVHFETRELSFRQGLDGVYRGHVDVLAAAFGDASRSVAHTAQSFELVWNESQYREGLRTGLAVSLRLPVPAATLQIRVVVRDAASGRVGSANRWTEVPAVQDGRLALSGVVLEAPGDLGKEESPQAPAVRIFRPGEAIHYRYELYNLSVDEAKASRIRMQLTFFQPGGTVIVEQPLTIDFEPKAAGKNPETSGNLTFAAVAAPGRYEMQVTVTDVLAPAGSARTATQFAEFELRP